MLLFSDALINPNPASFHLCPFSCFLAPAALARPDPNPVRQSLSSFRILLTTLLFLLSHAHLTTHSVHPLPPPVSRCYLSTLIACTGNHASCKVSAFLCLTSRQLSHPELWTLTSMPQEAETGAWLGVAEPALATMTHRHWVPHGLIPTRIAQSRSESPW
jgi:hypothetical protein